MHIHSYMSLTSILSSVVDISIWHCINIHHIMFVFSVSIMAIWVEAMDVVECVVVVVG